MISRAVAGVSIRQQAHAGRGTLNGLQSEEVQGLNWHQMWLACQYASIGSGSRGRTAWGSSAARGTALTDKMQPYLCRAAHFPGSVPPAMQGRALQTVYFVQDSKAVHVRLEGYACMA